MSVMMKKLARAARRRKEQAARFQDTPEERAAKKTERRERPFSVEATEILDDFAREGIKDIEVPLIPLTSPEDFAAALQDIRRRIAALRGGDDREKILVDDALTSAITKARALPHQGGASLRRPDAVKIVRNAITTIQKPAAEIAREAAKQRFPTSVDNAQLAAMGYPDVLQGETKRLSKQELTDVALLTSRVSYVSPDGNTLLLPKTEAKWVKFNDREYVNPSLLPFTRAAHESEARANYMAEVQAALTRHFMRKKVRDDMPFFPATPDQVAAAKKRSERLPIFGADARLETWLALTDRAGEQLWKEIEDDESLKAQYLPRGKYPSSDFSSGAAALKASQEIVTTGSPLERQLVKRADVGLGAAVATLGITAFLSRNPGALSLIPQVAGFLAQAAVAESVDISRRSPFTTARALVKWNAAIEEWVARAVAWRKQQNESGSADRSAVEMKRDAAEILSRYGFDDETLNAAFTDNIVRPIVARQEVIDIKGIPAVMREQQLAALDALYDVAPDIERILSVNARLLVNGGGADRLSSDAAGELSRRLFGTIADATKAVATLKKDSATAKMPSGMSTRTMIRIVDISNQKKGTRDREQISLLDRELENVAAESGMTMERLHEVEVAYDELRTRFEGVYRTEIMETLRPLFQEGATGDAAADKSARILATQSIDLSLFTAVKGDLKLMATRAQDAGLSKEDRDRANADLRLLDAAHGERLHGIQQAVIDATPGARSARIKYGLDRRPTLFAPSGNPASDLVVELSQLAGVGVMGMIRLLEATGVIDDSQAAALRHTVAGGVAAVASKPLGEALSLIGRWVGRGLGIVVPETKAGIIDAAKSAGERFGTMISAARNSAMITDMRSFLADTGDTLYDAADTTTSQIRDTMAQWGITGDEVDTALKRHRNDVDARSRRALDDPAVRAEIRKVESAKDSGLPVDDRALREAYQKSTTPERAAPKPGAPHAQEAPTDPGLLDRLWPDIKAALINGFNVTIATVMPLVAPMKEESGGALLTQNNRAVLVRKARELGMSEEAAETFVREEFPLPTETERAAAEEAENARIKEISDRNAARDAAELAKREAGFGSHPVPRRGP